MEEIAKTSYYFGGGKWLTNEEIALKGMGQTEILIDCAETNTDKMLARAMNEAFTNLWRILKNGDQH